MLDDGLSPVSESGGAPTVSVRPLRSHRNHHLLDRDLVLDPVQSPSSSRSASSSPLSSSSRHILHGPPRSPILPFFPLPAASAVTTRPRSAPPLLPSQDMARSAQEISNEVDSLGFCTQYNVFPEPETRVPSRRARGTQVKPSELPHEPLPLRSNLDPHQPLTLSDLSKKLKSNNEHLRRRVAVETRLHDLQVAAARTTRILQIAQPVRHVLAECIRTEDKSSFVHLFSAFQHTVTDAPTLDDGLPAVDSFSGHEELQYPESFIDSLSDSERDAICDLLTKVKTDGSFLVARVGSLSRRDLTALLPEKLLTKTIDSVFAAGPRPSSRVSGKLEGVVDGLTESLANFEFTSPLEALILSGRAVFPFSLKDDLAATATWAEVCARMLIEQNPGVDKFIPAVLDIWQYNSPWPGKDSLELWILETIQKGSFLLERPPSQSFQMRIQGKREPRPEDELRREAFFAQAVDSLLDLLGDCSSSSVIPEGVLSICTAIHERLNSSAGHQSAFAGFIATRWLVSSFLPDVLMLPETQGIASDRYISEHVRSRILREVASRVRRIVLDAVYAWKLGSRLSPQTVSRVGAVLKHFHSTAAPDMSNPTTPRLAPSSRSAHKREQDFIVVSSHDIRTIFNALYPRHTPPSFISDRDSTHSGLLSSASSVSGFSLFKNATSPEHNLVPYPTPVPELAHLMVSEPPRSDSARRLHY